jgi:hypothetical protein
MQIAKLGFARYREAMQLACCTAVELELTATAGQSRKAPSPSADFNDLSNTLYHGAALLDDLANDARFSDDALTVQWARGHPLAPSIRAWRRLLTHGRTVNAYHTHR